MVECIGVVVLLGGFDVARTGNFTFVRGGLSEYDPELIRMQFLLSVERNRVLGES